MICNPVHQVVCSAVTLLSHSVNESLQVGRELSVSLWNIIQLKLINSAERQKYNPEMVTINNYHTECCNHVWPPDILQSQ